MALHGGRLRRALLLCLAACAAALDDGVCADPAPVLTCSGPSTSEEFLAQLVNYDKSRRPPCGNATHAGPTHVEVQLFLTQVNDVDQKLGQVTVNGYLRWWWKDLRLAFASTAEGGCADSIAMATGEFDGIWRPDLYIKNIVKVDNAVGSQLLDVSHDGGVWMSQQVTIQVKTPLDLGQLPYDRHVARITMASYSQDTRRMRVAARGGSFGGGSSGAGIVAEPMISTVWTFLDPPGEAGGFATPGRVEVIRGWDYLHLEFAFARQPRYFYNQVIWPSMVFLLVSYSQFWVDAGATPARAALATIPLLIVRTMTNSMYESLPEGSQEMWLVDFLRAATVLVALAGLEFAVVNVLLLRERRNAAELAGLQKSKALAEKMKERCKAEGISLLELLDRCRPSTLEEDSAPRWAEAPTQRPPTQQPSAVGKLEEEPAYDAPLPSLAQVMPAQGSMLSRKSSGSLTSVSPRRVASKFLMTYSVKERDLLFIRYAERIFTGITDASVNQASPREVRKALKIFHVYMSTAETAAAMGMFLRDEGEVTPEDDMECRMTFSQFVFLLMNIEGYQDRRHAVPVKIARVYEGFFVMPPSQRVDIVARAGFPVLVALMFLVLYATLDQY